MKSGRFGEWQVCEDLTAISVLSTTCFVYIYKHLTFNWHILKNNITPIYVTLFKKSSRGRNVKNL